MKYLVFAALTALPVVLAQDYFPLQSGNQWLFRGSRFGQTLTVEVGEASLLDGVEYFAVSGFTPSRRWLRRAPDGALIEYDQNTRSVVTFLSLQFPQGVRFGTNVNECSKTAMVESRNAKIAIPAGAFDNALQLRYVDSECADAGIESDYFLPDVGPVKRVETSIAGPVTYELVYARVNGFITLAQPETGFALSTPSPVLENSRIFARMTVRNGGKGPLRLEFSSGQVFNLELRDAAGDIVYNWAADKLFTAVLQSIDVGQEKNWMSDFAVPNGLKPGLYTLEAYLTTMGTPERPYRAKVQLEVIARTQTASVEVH